MVINTIETIIYEQPLNEHTRVCLRLEKLFQQLAYFKQEITDWNIHACLSTMINIINMIDRPDLKSKLTHELKRHHHNLERLKNIPNIDHEKLDTICCDLSLVIEKLYTINGKLGQSLRDNEFINTTRQYILNSNIICSFDMPAYHYWINQSTEQQQYDLSNWMKSLETTKEAISILLHLIRQSNKTTSITAHKGFYQDNLDAQNTCQLIRVALPKEALLFPEISAGKHRFSIKFYHTAMNNRPKASEKNILFDLMLCTL